MLQIVFLGHNIFIQEWYIFNHILRGKGFPELRDMTNLLHFRVSTILDRWWSRETSQHLLIEGGLHSTSRLDIS